MLNLNLKPRMEMEIFPWYPTFTHLLQVIEEIGYKGMYARITKKFMSVVYQKLFENEPPFMSNRGNNSLHVTSFCINIPLWLVRKEF